MAGKDTKDILSRMSPDFSMQLNRLGRTLNRWEAQVQGAWCLAAALGWLVILSLVDVFFPVSRLGRALAATGLMGMISFTAWQIARILRRTFSNEGVAARVERTFPELDNHLINYLQFSLEGKANPFKAAYLDHGEPPWQRLDFRRMRDLSAHRRSLGTLVAVLGSLIILWAVFGSSWGVAMWRMINPFSAVEPTTLTHLVSVAPGDSSLLQGEALLVEATVEGFAGHPVKLDLDPDDGDRKTVVLGAVSSSREQVFSHRLPRVHANLRYRIRAGDARPSRWFEVSARPPPAFTRVAITMTPPEYTGKPTATYDAHVDECVVYQGATLTLEVSGNTPLAAAEIVRADVPSHPLETSNGHTEWRGALQWIEGPVLTIRGTDTYGTSFEEVVRIQLVPDRPPVLEIHAPRGRVQLPPGQRPRIEFTVLDDYGLVSAEIQDVVGTGDDGDAVAVKTWMLAEVPSHAVVWERDTALRARGEAAFRVVAKDNNPFVDQPVRSLPLAFGMTSHGDAAKQRNELEQKTFAGIRRIIELQQANILRTEAQLSGRKPAGAQSWNKTAEVQQGIRTLTRELLDSPIRPFAGMTTRIKKLYLEEMSTAVRVLRQLPGQPEESVAELGKDALHLQQQILRQLGHAETEAASAATERRVSGLSAMLQAMIRDQGTVRKKTGEFVESGARVGIPLVDAQDVLAEDLSAFVTACTAEADAVRGSDEAFASLLAKMATQAESLQIRNQMVLAAERLDQNLPGDAVPHEEKALGGLQHLQQALDDVTLEQEADKRTVLAEALGNAKERLGRVRDLRARMLDSMDAIRGQEDQSDGAVEAFEEAYEQLAENTRETLLEIPTDLHTFADMQAANDLVEDVFEVFEEIEQTEGTETADGEEVKLLDFAKEDANLELMDEAIERIDEIETWLLENPDEKRVTAEAFDREEMPEEGIAKGALAEEVQDLISDLLDESEEQEDEAQDSASTHGVTDMETGWGVEEGETVTFSAKGKSGNRTPDHKEQDGRSNVGRQGMAVGETAAASGTINQGDDNIEERRTEDPTQGGQIDLAGEADTRATGGGKQGTGKADDYGMSGGVKRIDSAEQGSWEGMAALMAKQADALYAKASLKNVRVAALQEAAHHLRQAEDALARGNIEQMKEFRRLAAVSLQRARAQLAAGPSRTIDTGGAGTFIEDVVEGGSELAPAAYRDQVAEYYRALNEVL